MRRFSELDQTKVGIAGVAVLAILLGTAVNAGRIQGALLGRDYSAAFAEAGGLRDGDEVMISGFAVGAVESIELDGDHVRVGFSIDDRPLGTGTRASIKTASALGTKFLQLEPAGGGAMAVGDQIPLSRTTAPYDVTEALSDLTVSTGEIDTTRLARSLDTLAGTFAGTPPELRGALTGIRRLSTTIAARDQALRQVLAGASGVSGVLAERNAQIVRLMTDGSSLLAELEARKETIDALLVNVRRASDQLSGLVRDNAATLRPALIELRKTLRILNKNADALDETIKLLGPFGRSLGEAVGGGPFFYAYLVNIAPTNLVPILPKLFGVGQPPNYGQPPPQPTPPPGVGRRPSTDQPIFPNIEPTAPARETPRQERTGQ